LLGTKGYVVVVVAASISEVYKWKKAHIYYPDTKNDACAKNMYYSGAHKWQALAEHMFSFWYAGEVFGKKDISQQY
jgi:hypothetical protein